MFTIYIYTTSEYESKRNNLRQQEDHSRLFNKKKLQNVVWYHFGHTSFVYLIQFTASSFNLPFILPSISWDKHFSVYGFSISYILFCFAKHFVFVIAQFKKPHLSRSRYPLRLLLWLQLMLVCNHHLFIFEKAKHETIFIL